MGAHKQLSSENCINRTRIGKRPTTDGTISLDNIYNPVPDTKTSREQFCALPLESDFKEKNVKINTKTKACIVLKIKILLSSHY